MMKQPLDRHQALAANGIVFSLHIETVTVLKAVQSLSRDIAGTTRRTREGSADVIRRDRERRVEGQRSVVKS